jgi:hypothetical protein
MLYATWQPSEVAYLPLHPMARFCKVELHLPLFQALNTPYTTQHNIQHLPDFKLSYLSQYKELGLHSGTIRKHFASSFQPSPLPYPISFLSFSSSNIPPGLPSLSFPHTFHFIGFDVSFETTFPATKLWTIKRPFYRKKIIEIGAVLQKI